MEERQLQEQEQASHPALTVVDAGRWATNLLALLKKKDLPGLRARIARLAGVPEIISNPAWHESLLTLAVRAADDGDRDFVMYFVEELGVPIQASAAAATECPTEDETSLPSTPLFGAVKNGHEDLALEMLRLRRQENLDLERLFNGATLLMLAPLQRMGWRVWCESALSMTLIWMLAYADTRPCVWPP